MKRRAILEWDREKEVKTVDRAEDIKITALYERLSQGDE